MPKVLITETVLRDAQQSLVQGRLKLQHVLPIAKTLDDIGYHALDAWGGWTFAAQVRALKEDPWQRLRAMRAAIVKTPLQMLIRGQTLLGQSHQPDDVVRAFIEQAVEDGIRVIKLFDPLNDLRNLEVPVEVARKAGARVIGALVYSPSPVADESRVVKSASRLKAMGVDWIGIEDVAGILAPVDARGLVTAITRATRLPVTIHSHSTTALAPISYFAAIEAGATGIDTALSALAWGASQPATETMVASLRDGPYDTGLDLNVIGQASRYFDEIHDEYLEFQDPIPAHRAALPRLRQGPVRRAARPYRPGGPQTCAGLIQCDHASAGRPVAAGDRPRAAGDAQAGAESLRRGPGAHLHPVSRGRPQHPSPRGAPSRDPRRSGARSGSRAATGTTAGLRRARTGRSDRGGRPRVHRRSRRRTVSGSDPRRRRSAGHRGDACHVGPNRGATRRW